jgi:hypothetical protein
LWKRNLKAPAPRRERERSWLLEEKEKGFQLVEEKTKGFRLVEEEEKRF